MNRPAFMPSLALLTLMMPTAIANDTPQLKDIRLGAENGMTRLEIVCAKTCRAMKSRDGNFILEGVSGGMVKDVSGSRTLLGTIALSPHPIGAILKVEATAPITTIAVQNCGATSICFDYIGHSRPYDPSHSTMASLPETKTVPKPYGQTPYNAKGITEAEQSPVVLKTTELADQRISAVNEAQIKQPDHIEVIPNPSPKPRREMPAPPVVAKVSIPMPPPLEKPIEAPKELELQNLIQGPSSQEQFQPTDWNNALSAKLQSLASTEITPEGCSKAEQLLQSNADNLNLFAYTAYCAAIIGKKAEANARLTRMQQVNPDNQKIAQALIFINEKPKLRGLRLGGDTAKKKKTGLR